MPQISTRICGIAFGIIALALTPAMTLANDADALREQHANRATVITRDSDDIGCDTHYRDEPRLGGTIWQVPCARLAGFGHAAGTSALTLKTIKFFEDNIWDLEGLAQPAGVEPGYWYPSPDVAWQLGDQRPF